MRVPRLINHRGTAGQGVVLHNHQSDAQETPSGAVVLISLGSKALPILSS
jgi:hypothetical protein